MWIWGFVVCASLSAAVDLEGQFTFPEAPRLPELANATFTDLELSQPLLDKRQSTCYSPNRWCSGKLAALLYPTPLTRVLRYWPMLRTEH